MSSSPSDKPTKPSAAKVCVMCETPIYFGEAYSEGRNVFVHADRSTCKRNIVQAKPVEAESGVEAPPTVGEVSQKAALIQQAQKIVRLEAEIKALRAALPQETPAQPCMVGWNEGLRAIFEAEAKRFHLPLEMKDERLQNYAAHETRIAYIMFQFGYHQAAQIPLPQETPAQPIEVTRFAEFDDAEHPANQWWEKHGQYMLSGGGRREFIWACRGWIAREQLACGVDVTGDSMQEAALASSAPAPSGVEQRAATELRTLLNRWEGYFEAFTSPFYTKTGEPDAMQGLRQCITELQELLEAEAALRGGGD
jgi:hypothetical protein